MNDEKTVSSAVRELIRRERKQGHNNVADQLERVLSLRAPHSSQRTIRDTVTAPAVPRSKGDGSALVDVRKCSKSLDDIVLREETAAKICRFLQEYSKQELLNRYGLLPKQKLLFFGPPGNGKTYAAEVIASELGLPLFYVRFDGLVGSYLGETASNLRKVFEFAHSGLGILFFDEFDAIAKRRNDPNDVGELKRVVNSFLQLLDGYQGKSPIIAATNHEDILDYALWRRFDDAVFFPLPNEVELQRYIKLRLSGFSIEGFASEDVAKWVLGFSFAVVQRIVTDAIKTMILTGEGVISRGMLRDAIERSRSSEIHKLDRMSEPNIHR
ncbi:MAG TPA: ATP-binding protein [Candidatus Angelobacter sp.]|nr:ATP-binding protein [Candidatus Angelobacter sp.]